MEIPYFLNPINYLKVFYKPLKIIPTIKFKYTKWYEKKHDVKYKKIPDATVLSMYREALATLGRINEKFNPEPLKIQMVDEFIGSNTFSKDCILLGDLFTKYGSDKSVTHSYYRVYYHFLRDKRDQPLRIFEIGLGTNNIDVLSNMGTNGKPGASLRAFRDFCPNATIVGADIDKRILFSEDRIETVFIDQADPLTMNEAAQKFGNEKFDLIIDDGWHVPQANLNTIEWGLSLLNETGVLVVEDIHIRDYIYYQCLFYLIQKDFKLAFVKDKAACMAIISKRQSVTSK